MSTPKAIADDVTIADTMSLKDKLATDIPLEEKLAAIEAAMASAMEQAQENAQANGGIVVPVDPADQFMCVGCQ